jgi:hypothetical protein
MTSQLTDAEIHDRLDSFLQLFIPTLELADRLRDSKTHAQEILALVCARLDGLACSSFAEDYPRKKAFVEFVTSYGGQKQLLQSVSVGDLYADLTYHRWLLEVMIESPGRIHRYSSQDDAFIRFLDRSGVPFTVHDCDRVIRLILTSLRQAFRVSPGQSKLKPPTGTVEGVVAAVLQGFSGSRRAILAERLADSLAPLVKTKTVATILYEKFRSGVIHGAHVQLDNRRFFGLAGVYWNPNYSDYYGPALKVEFPARFLIDLLEHSMLTYGRHMVSTRKIPPDVYFRVFDQDMLDHLPLLDQSAIPDKGIIRLDIPQR